MSLSPQDIVEVELRQAMRGYATADVDDLLRRVSETLQARDDELAELRARLAEADAKVAEAEASQRSVQQALVTAHAAAEQTLRRAEEEAEALREGARRDLDVDADEARREWERIVEEGRAAQQRQHEEFESARKRLQAAYDEQRGELGERLDLLRERLVVCEGFLRSHIEEQELALDRILGRIEEAGEPVGSEDDDLPETDPEAERSQAPDEPGEPEEPEGPDTDELPSVDVDAVLAGSSHAQADQDPTTHDASDEALDDGQEEVASPDR
ncbi:MAG: DivIVA domain-containing protein [Nitriliruptor sp.]|nr:MAG: DivIVA domain-containing protein [Nitriliruptor sp.]